MRAPDADLTIHDIKGRDTAHWHGVASESDENAGADMVQGGKALRRSGLYGLHKACPDAPGCFNLEPGTWTRTPLLRR